MEIETASTDLRRQRSRNPAETQFTGLFTEFFSQRLTHRPLNIHQGPPFVIVFASVLFSVSLSLSLSLSLCGCCFFCVIYCENGTGKRFGKCRTRFRCCHYFIVSKVGGLAAKNGAKNKTNESKKEKNHQKKNKSIKKPSPSRPGEELAHSGHFPFFPFSSSTNQVKLGKTQ